MRSLGIIIEADQEKVELAGITIGPARPRDVRNRELLAWKFPALAGEFGSMRSTVPFWDDEGFMCGPDDIACCGSVLLA